MTFAALKKKFVKCLRKPAVAPAAGFLEMGSRDHSKRKYEVEGDYSIMVDPEGDAWVFLGPHESLARQVKQEPDA